MKYEYFAWGALSRAEIIPNEPDPDNAGVGIAIFKCILYTPLA